MKQRNHKVISKLTAILALTPRIWGTHRHLFSAFQYFPPIMLNLTLNSSYYTTFPNFNLEIDTSFEMIPAENFHNIYGLHNGVHHPAETSAGWGVGANIGKRFNKKITRQRNKRDYCSAADDGRFWLAVQLLERPYTAAPLGLRLGSSVRMTEWVAISFSMLTFYLCSNFCTV